MSTTTEGWDTPDYRSYLRGLDAADIDVTDFEANFIESNLNRSFPFTPAQIEVIERLIENYGDDF